MRIFIFTIMLLAASAEIFAQKRLNDSILVLKLEIDSMKTLLADARREVKKCSDLLNLLKDKSDQQLSITDSAKNKLLVENQLLKNRIGAISDSLENSVNAAALLQKIISEKAFADNQAANRANLFAQKLKDSLVDIPKNLCYIYSREKDVYVVLSDTLLFGSNFYLSNQGKQFLERILKLIRNETSSFVNIKTFANRAAKKQEIWLQANNRSRVLTTFFENIYFPYDRYTATSAAISQEYKDYQLAPLIFEIQLK